MYLLEREFKSNRKSLIIWICACSMIMGMSLAMFPSFASQGDYLTEVMASFPEEMLAAINAVNLDFSNPMDYFGYIYQYVLLGAAIMAMLLGVNVLGKEEGEKTIEFLNAKPISRSSIVTQKLLFVLSQLLLFSGVMTVIPYLLMNLVTDVAIEFEPFLLVGLGTFLAQVLFASLGSTVSTFVIKAKHGMPVALGVIFLMYFVSMMQGILPDLEWLKYLSPFSFFNVGNIINQGALQMYGVWIAIILSIIIVSFTYSLYNRKDFSN